MERIEVQHLGGCPRVVRGDVGTENGQIQDFQLFGMFQYCHSTNFIFVVFLAKGMQGILDFLVF